MSSDPISRFAFAVQEIDRTLGPGYAKQHSDVVCSVMASAASDYAALAIARSLDTIAAALLEPDDIVPISRPVSTVR